MKKGLLLIAAIIFIAFNSNAQLALDDFQDEDMAGWLTVSPTYASYNTTWHINNHDGDIALRASCFSSGSNHVTEQWVVSPSFSTTGLTNVTLKFDNDQNYDPYQDLEAYYSTNFTGDSASFSSATWTKITGLTLSSGDWAVASSSNDMTAAAGNASVYVAFKYVSTASEGGVWDIDNVAVTSTVTINNISTSINLFPNPASSVLNIQGEVNISNITVANVIGQRVLRVNNINANNHKLELYNLKNGVYLININNVDGTSSVARFVKK